MLGAVAPQALLPTRALCHSSLTDSVKVWAVFSLRWCINFHFHSKWPFFEIPAATIRCVSSSTRFFDATVVVIFKTDWFSLGSSYARVWSFGCWQRDLKIDRRRMLSFMYIYNVLYKKQYRKSRAIFFCLILYMHPCKEISKWAENSSFFRVIHKFFLVKDLKRFT